MSEGIRNNILSRPPGTVHQESDWGGLQLSVAGILNSMKDQLLFFWIKKSAEIIEGNDLCHAAESIEFWSFEA